MRSVLITEKGSTYFLLFMFTSFMLLCHTVVAQESFPRLVDAKWLKDNLSLKNMRIVDVRDDVKNYWSGHIPAAVYIDPDALRWPEGGIPAKLVQPEALVQLLGEMGIDEKTLVVTYSEKGDYNASYFVWALDYIGHTHSAILNGGFDKWEKEGGAVTQDFPEIQPAQYPEPSQLREDVRAMLDEIKETVDNDDVILLDVRPLDMYTGQKGFWKHKGHIHGAVHHFVGDDLNKDGTWRKKSDLVKEYEKLGATPDKTVIVSCGSGMMSSQAYFTLKHVLDYPKVKNYDGSFSEWSSLKEVPVDSGLSASPVAEELLQSRCTACHDLNRVYKEKKDRAGWEKIIDRMIKRGAKLDETERVTLVEFLSVKEK